MGGGKRGDYELVRVFNPLHIIKNWRGVTFYSCVSQKPGRVLR